MSKGSLKPVKILLFIAISAIFSSSYGAKANIEEQAKIFVREQIATQIEKGDITRITVQPLNSHLRLTPCREDIQFISSTPIKPGRFNIKASCKAPRRWSVNIRGQIKLLRPVVVSQRPLPRKSIISPSDLNLELKELSALRNGYFKDIQALDGYELKQTVREQQVLSPKLLLPPLLIRKDEQVVIHAGQKGILAVRVAGIALEDGRRNQQIRIRNTNSGKVINARVIAIGQVKAGR